MALFKRGCIGTCIIQELQKLMDDPAFHTEISYAIKHPNSKKALEMTELVEKIITPVGARIRHSVRERKASMGTLYAYNQVEIYYKS